MINCFSMIRYLAIKSICPERKIATWFIAKNTKKILRFFLACGLIVSFILYGENSLASAKKICGDPNEVWHDCIGDAVFENGDRYVGEWNNDELNGYGFYFGTDGWAEGGFWRDGILTDISGDLLVETGISDEGSQQRSEAIVNTASCGSSLWIFGIYF